VPCATHVPGKLEADESPVIKQFCRFSEYRDKGAITELTAACRGCSRFLSIGRAREMRARVVSNVCLFQKRACPRAVPFIFANRSRIPGDFGSKRISLGANRGSTDPMSSAANCHSASRLSPSPAEAKSAGMRVLGKFSSSNVTIRDNS